MSYHGSSYDRYVAHNEHSTLHKMKETYWNTKQAVYKKLGKKQDEHIVASDSLLDSKLELFGAIQKSSIDLLKAVEKYQDRLCCLSQEENAMGRFLKAEGQLDKTRAGKMMGAVGKAQSFSSQQRLALRVPLVRLYQEVETFRYRAISDTLLTINRMEGARTEYRAALMWMKDVSEELDPDTFKQLEKFRKVQAQVKKTKAKFDKLKLDTMQKIDLLAASRCNMFSHVLANYQSTLLHFWSKTSRTMTAVAESFKGYQYYEFNMLKELAEPSKKLAEETGSRLQPERDVDGDGIFDPEDPDFFCEKIPEKPSSSQLQGQKSHHDPTDQGLPSLIDLEDQQKALRRQADGGSLTNLLQAIDKEIERPGEGGRAAGAAGDDPFLDFGEEEDLEEIKRKQEEQYDFSGFSAAMAQRHPPQGESAGKKGKGKQNVPKDLLTDDPEEDDLEKDDMTLLNELLNDPSAEGDDFTREWQAVFGVTPLSNNSNITVGETDQTPTGQEFMPSMLLDQRMMDQRMGQMSMAPPMQAGGMSGQLRGPAGAQQKQATAGSQAAAAQTPKAKSKKGQKSDMSAWFNLFADLDPLSNPDAIGRSAADEMTDA